MSLQNELRRTSKVNLEYTAKRLRQEIGALCRLIAINLDCSLKEPEDLPIPEVDAQMDELKAKWSELRVTNEKIRRLDEELG